MCAKCCLFTSIQRSGNDFQTATSIKFSILRGKKSPTIFELSDTKYSELSRKGTPSGIENSVRYGAVRTTFYLQSIITDFWKAPETDKTNINRTALPGAKLGALTRHGSRACNKRPNDITHTHDELEIYARHLSCPKKLVYM